MGRIPQVWVHVILALFLLLGSIPPLSNLGRGSAVDIQPTETFEEASQAIEYFYGPVSGQKYMILKDLEKGKTYYFGNGLLFDGFDSLITYERGLAKDASYKLDSSLREGLRSRSQDEILGIVVEMRDQPSHRISLEVRARHRSSLQALLDERDSIYAGVRARIPSLDRPLEALMSPAEARHLKEVNLKIDRKMYSIRKEIMDITMIENARIQEGLVSELRARGFHVGYQGHLFNSFSARVPIWFLEKIAEREDVAHIYPGFKMYPLLDHSPNAIYANVMWNNGITGGPWDLAVADTGIDGSHPNLHEEWEKVVHDNGQFDPKYNDDPSSTDDFHGHGTHIAGIILSDDPTYRGVAYGMGDMIDAKFGYDTTDGLGGGDWRDFMEVTDWAIQTAGADVLSLSFGSSGITNGNSGPSRFLDAVVDDLGIPVAVAAGNNGPSSGTITIPADAFNILAVGSMNDGNSDSRVGDVLSGYSSRGPIDDGRIKPDVVAPGQNIHSANNDWESAADFVDMSGTSMAAPHVAAALLLMMNYTNDPSLFPAVYKALMINHAEGWGATSPNNLTGWGYIDMNKTLSWMDYHVEGFVNATLRYRFYQSSASAGDKATLAWQKHSVYIGASFPFQHWPPNDLDLYVYEMPTRTQLGVSDFALSNIEQIEFDSDRPNILFKVRAFGDIDGTINEPFSLAVMSNLTEIFPPFFTIDVNAPSTVMFGDTFNVFANITNVGDLEAWNTNGRINLPPGLTLVGGPNPSLLGNLPVGSTAMVSWQIRADAVGPQSFNVDAYSSSLGEIFQNNSGNIVVTVQDVELPVIQDVTALPSPQEVFGPVNISAVVLDNTGISEVRVDITKPDMTQYGNQTMAYDSGSGRFFYLDSYSDLGTYTFEIWAVDINNNWNSSSGSFLIQDTTPPEIRNVLAVPSPQEVFGSVNISCSVTDNYMLGSVFLEIVDPLLGITNTSMTAGLFDEYFQEKSYNLLGTYNFTIWAVDSLGQWNSSSGQFVIQDTTLPVANAGPDQFGVLIGTPVTFNGSLSSDNYGIASYLWTFMDGVQQTLSGPTPQYVFFNASCYDVTLNVTDIAGNYATDSMIVCTIERNPPKIMNAQATPNPQEVFGVVNISANVWDDYGLVDVSLEVVSPDMTTTNTSMTIGLGDLYYYSRMYTLLGSYNYTIWALDVYGNWNFSKGSFSIEDWTPPELNNLGVNPGTQQIHGSVNVTILVTDNYQLDEVVINITDPDGLAILNVSMSFFTLALQHFYMDSYHKIGSYNFTIWAGDSSGNWNRTQGSFLIVDTLVPTFLNIGAVPNPQEVFYSVNITSSIADNHLVSEAWVNVSGPEGYVGNYSMIKIMTGEYFFEREYNKVGLYTYKIWASDMVGNWNSLGSTFNIIDGTRPEVTTLNTTSTIEVYLTINLTANATDNYELAGAWLVIYTPSGSPLGNFTMMENPGDVANFYYELTFASLGEYSYFVAAKDTSSNWNASWATLVVVDETPPVADAGKEQVVEQGTNVRLDGRGSTDNFGPIAYYNWSFMYDGRNVQLTGAQTTFVFEIVGNYTISLVVTDGSGNTDNDITWVNVTSRDSDGDGLTDDEESVHNTNPLDSDTDDDGLNDYEEIQMGTNPRDNDSDDDGILDGMDDDPLVPSSQGGAEEPFLMKYWWIMMLLLLLVVLLLPILLASGKKRKKDEEMRVRERMRRRTQPERMLSEQRRRIPPPSSEEPPPPIEEPPPPPPDDDLPPPPPVD